MPRTRSKDKDIRRVAESLIERVLKLREDAENRRISPLELVPIDPVGIATVLGLDVEKVGELSGVDGELDRRTSSVSVRDRVSRAPARARQRFTIAHELGHFSLEHQGDVHHRSTSTEIKSAQEREADQFAVELLTPESIVTPIFVRYFGKVLDHKHLTQDEAFFLSQGPGQNFTVSAFKEMTALHFAKLVSIAKGFNRCQFDSLCDKFGVSIEAMAIRLLELGLVR